LDSAKKQGATVHVSHDNCGQGAAVGVGVNRNRAIACCDRFQYLVHLDADDSLPNDYVYHLMRVADGQPCVVVCGADVFTGAEPVSTIEVRRPLTLRTLLEENTIHVSALIHTSLLTKYGGFDEKLPAFEDWDYWGKLMSQRVEFRYCATTRLNNYRHADSRHAQKSVKFADMQKTMIARYGTFV
jgi:hypothetical protein